MTTESEATEAIARECEAAYRGLHAIHDRAADSPETVTREQLIELVQAFIDAAVPAMEALNHAAGMIEWPDPWAHDLPQGESLLNWPGPPYAREGSGGRD
jgi:hypothetical protein